jgi:hypothetical protein
VAQLGVRVDESGPSGAVTVAEPSAIYARDVVLRCTARLLDVLGKNAVPLVDDAALVARSTYARARRGARRALRGTRRLMTAR